MEVYEIRVWISKLCFVSCQKSVFGSESKQKGLGIVVAGKKSGLRAPSLEVLEDRCDP